MTPLDPRCKCKGLPTEPFVLTTYCPIHGGAEPEPDCSDIPEADAAWFEKARLVLPYALASERARAIPEAGAELDPLHMIAWQLQRIIDFNPDAPDELVPFVDVNMRALKSWVTELVNASLALRQFAKPLN